VAALEQSASTLWPAARVVAQLPGSLPNGGTVQGTPIHAFATPPSQFVLRADAGLKPTRTDIDLGGLLAFEISNVVTAQEADAIVAASEWFGYRDEAPGIHTPPGMRMNKSVHWLAEAAMMQTLFNRIGALLPAQIDGMQLHPRLSERINMYRYDDGDVFNLHIDGDWPGFGLSADRTRMEEWPRLRSCLTMILYLNGPQDGVQGGYTRLLKLDGSAHDVQPAKGSALFFRHGFTPQSVRHIGLPVRGPVAKYVARINVMYAPAA
jgi:predicted 2-oxoglutarate/Fe(II)-dependent dioxygenase YbiX